MNNLITIHFFKNNSDHKRIEYTEVLDYFQEIPNFQIFYSEDNVEIEYSDKEFGFKYRYLITKKSRVEQIYKLNPCFTNINLLLEFPIAIPTYLAKEVFTQAQKLCRKFELGVYNNMFQDVSLFDLVTLVSFYEEEKKKYLAEAEENHTLNMIRYDSGKLSDICAFQRHADVLSEHYHNDVIVDNVYAIRQKDPEDEEIIQGTCYDWVLGTPVIFPPHVDFIYIKTDDDCFYIRKADLVKILEKKLIAVKEFVSDDMYVLQAKQAKKSKRYIKKFLKHEIDEQFERLQLLDCIEE